MLEHYTFQLHPAVQSRLVNIPLIHRKCEELENWDSVNTIFKAVCKFWLLLAKFLVTGMSDISAGVTLNISFIWTMSQKSRKWKKLWDIIPSFKRKDWRKKYFMSMILPVPSDLVGANSGLAHSHQRAGPLHHWWSFQRPLQGGLLQLDFTGL